MQAHNRKILTAKPKTPPNQPKEKNCNCRNKDNCPLDKDCQREGIYKATVRATGKFYVGSSINFKQRWDGHKFPFRHSEEKGEVNSP